MDIRGEVAPGFEPAGEAFARCVAELGETSACAAAVVDGRLVVDLWVGLRRDSLMHVFSAVKPVTALCALLLVDRGALELDEPVAEVWPEFAAGGKEAATVRHVLAHQAGVPALRTPRPTELLYDWEAMTAAVAAEPAWWAPGTAHGEHALTYGHLVGEIVRRVDGRRLSAFLEAEIARPWELDLRVGLGPADRARCVPLVDPGGRWSAEVRAEQGDLYRAAVDNPPGLLDVEILNSDAWRAAEIPAVNGHGDARSLARLYGALAAGGEIGGVRLLGADTLAEATRVQRRGVDEVLGVEQEWGLGPAIDIDGFGLGGIGGTLAWADPDVGLGFAYVTARMGDHDRAEAVYDAVRGVLAG